MHLFKDAGLGFARISLCVEKVDCTLNIYVRNKGITDDWPK